jgi:hypothetical protein
MESNQSIWNKSFSKSIIENSQLVFSKKITASVVDREDNTAINEILDIEGIEQYDDLKNSAILTYIDNRTNFYKCLKENPIAYLSIYFPMSREKYKLTCLISSISGNKNDHSSVDCNKPQINSYLQKNHGCVKSILKEDVDEGIHKTKSEEYIKSVYNTLNAINREEVLNTHWGKLDNEEKLYYTEVHPDSIKMDVKLADVDKFECQEEMTYSKNFATVYFFPLEVEHSIYPMPQVVANSRKPNFESLYKPHKKLKKFYFIFSLINLAWTIKELNA